jgi:hypothetical protein
VDNPESPRFGIDHVRPPGGDFAACATRCGKSGNILILSPDVVIVNLRYSFDDAVAAMNLLRIDLKGDSGEDDSTLVIDGFPLRTYDRVGIHSGIVREEWLYANSI